MNVHQSSGSSAASRLQPTSFHAIRDVVRLHCDPREGSPYWIEQCQGRQLDPESFTGFEDLLRFGWMDEDALRQRPIDDFLPASVRNDRGERLILAQSSGFLGDAKTAAFSTGEFRAAFIEPFEPAAAAAGFPTTGYWLWLGPSGPHPIGQAARSLAWMRSGRDPFSVDFDPRWFNRLAPSSFARERYMAHLAEQALAILDREPIEILFATPSTLEFLAPRMMDRSRYRIRGIHYGGQTVSPERLATLCESFPEAVHLAGYGNSMAGVAMEYPRFGEPGPCYFSHAARLRYRLIDPEATSSKPPLDWERVDYGERGRVVLDRFDPSMMILNLLERDEATRIYPGDELRDLGIESDGLGNPQPAREFLTNHVEGIY